MITLTYSRSRTVNVMCAINVLDLFQRAILINRERHENDYDLYFWTESKHPIAKPSVDVGKPYRPVLPPMKHY